MTDTFKIGIAGLGTVGAGVVRIIERHASMLAAKSGKRLEITAVSANNRGKDRGVSLDGYRWFDDAVSMASDDDIDLVLELIGGSDGIAKAIVEKATASKKHVVTANKALIAHHGKDLAMAAESAGISLRFEAAVAGGIPIIKALREGLAANAVTRVFGILNGTCNYILSEMNDSGREFEDVLKEAQELGFAEADPAFDIDGVDAAHKLAILASLAFSTDIDFAAVHVEGIRNISPVDMEFARELGYGIKLLGVASLSEKGIEQRVHPCMVPVESPINHVNSVFNAIVCDGDFVDRTMFEGRGAGEGPTASAVVADIIDAARGNDLPTFGVPASTLADPETLPMDQHFGAYYIRLNVVDEPGVFAGIALSLKNHNVSMEKVLQRGRAPGEPVSVVITVHETRESDLMKTLQEISVLEPVLAPPAVIRIEQL